MIIQYLIIINLISGIVFFIDKQKSKKNKPRINEKTLHFLELIGGIFAILALMYLIKHKNRKLKYYILSWIILILWCIVITFIFY